jgi:hypothetical protein
MLTEEPSDTTTPISPVLMAATGAAITCSGAAIGALIATEDLHVVLMTTTAACIANLLGDAISVSSSAGEESEHVDWGTAGTIAGVESIIDVALISYLVVAALTIGVISSRAQRIGLILGAVGIVLVLLGGIGYFSGEMTWESYGNRALLVAIVVLIVTGLTILLNNIPLFNTEVRHAKLVLKEK